MAPPRPYWKGYLKLSLVSCPIALYTATSSAERVAFRQINEKTGNRLRQQLVDEESGEPIDPEDKGRGYEVEKGVYIHVEDTTPCAARTWLALAPWSCSGRAAAVCSARP
jgi:DNA end-binding protein Ku